MLTEKSLVSNFVDRKKKQKMFQRKKSAGIFY